MSHLEKIERACTRLAEMQHGVISRVQAVKLGMTKASVEERLSLRKWIALLPGVYRIAGVPVSRRMHLMAALLWAGAGSFLSHRTAGVLWELDGVTDVEEIELSVRVGAKRPGLIIHRIGPADRPVVRTINGLKVSCIERTLFDLSGRLPRQLAGMAIDDALRRRLTTLDRLWDQWESHGKRGRRGTKALRQLLMARDDREGLLRSRLESKMLQILKRIGVEPMRPNHRVSDRDRVAYLDFAYPDLKLAIETHGARWHEGTERWKKDLARDRWLKMLGWTVLYFSWDDVHLNPRKVEEEIRTFLNRQALVGVV